MAHPDENEGMLDRRKVWLISWKYLKFTDQKVSSLSSLLPRRFVLSKPTNIPSTFRAKMIHGVSPNSKMCVKRRGCTRWSLSHVFQNFRVQIHESKPFDSTFSIVGIDASIANAFRRILLAEVPSLCIENVYINNNTSIIQDEVLAQRLGLIPLKGNPAGLKWMKWVKKATSGETESRLSDYNTVILSLNVACTWKENGKQLFRQGETDPKKLYNNSNGKC